MDVCDFLNNSLMVLQPICSSSVRKFTKLNTSMDITLGLSRTLGFPLFLSSHRGEPKKCIIPPNVGEEDVFPPTMWLPQRHINWVKKRS